MSDTTILGQIMTQKHAEDLRNLNAVASVESLLKSITQREGDILTRRFGLGRNIKASTLEEIGKALKVTRERVRQVIKSSIAKLQKTYVAHDDVIRFAKIAEQLLHSLGGVAEERLFVTRLLDLTNVTANDKEELENIIRHTEFILKEILSDAIEYKEGDDALNARYRLLTADENLIHETIRQYLAIFDEAEKPLPAKEFISKFLATSFFSEHRNTLVDEPERHINELFGVISEPNAGEAMIDKDNLLLAYASLSVNLKRNIFEEWGRSSWPTIRPKRMNDKIYLILQHENKPLHFNSIAEKINETKFDRKIARSPSVHNELILDNRFVLVGRGMYALKEWGFESGTVAEVIEELLKQTPGLTREQILDEVMRRRFVKKQTVYLALMNKNRFSRLANGGYTLV